MKKAAETTPSASGKKKRRLWLIPVILLLVIAVPVVAMYFVDAPSREELKSLSFQQIDFNSLHDGTYTGSFTGTKGSLRDATVEVTIVDGSVSDVRVLKGAVDDEGNPQELGSGLTANDLFGSVLEQKTLQVDGISGATLTCNAHLKALENALLQAQSEE